MIARFKARCLLTEDHDKFRIKVIDRAERAERYVTKPEGQLMIRGTVLLAPNSFDSRAQKCIYEPLVSKNNFYKIIGVLNGIGDYKNYWVEVNLELMIFSHDGIKWEISIEDAERITDARFKEEETDMKTRVIYKVEATLYFTPEFRFVYFDKDEYERRIKERCEGPGYDKRPFPNYNGRKRDSVRFIVKDYTGPTIPDKTYVKMNCNVIIRDIEDLDTVNIKCNSVYGECDEEETDMSKKEINEESYAREAAAAIRKGMQEWKQHRDQMKAPVVPAIMDIKFNGPATIIFWSDGTKTVVKQNENEPYFDKEKAIAMAVLKKSYPGNAYHKLFNLDEYFRKQLRAAEKKRDSILSQIKDARKPKVTSQLEQELYKIDDEIARLKKEVEKFE